MRERGVAKRSRRNATFPPHDPRAIKAALRRELYELGSSRRYLDDIEFVAQPESPLAISPVVNGIDLPEHFGQTPLSAFAREWYLDGLTDTDGRRRGIPFTYGEKPGLICCREYLDIDVVGRYVRWELPDSLEGAPFVFDRAIYRERLEWTLAQLREHEPDFHRVRREFFQRTPWNGPKNMGLSLPDIGTDGMGAPALMFSHLMWSTHITLVVGERGEPMEAALARATHLIARWDVTELRAVWHGRVKPPSYPDHWTPSVPGLVFQFPV